MLYPKEVLRRDHLRYFKVNQFASRPFGWAVWHLCRMGDRSMADSRPKGPPSLAGPPSGGRAAF